MASEENGRSQGKAKAEHGQLTPEPSVEPEQVKGVQTNARSDTSSNPDTTAGSSTQPEPNSDENAVPTSDNAKAEESELSTKGDAGQAASSTSGPSGIENPTIKKESNDGHTTENDQIASKYREPQAREIERILATDPKFPFKVLGLEGLNDKDKVQKRYQDLMQFVHPDKCKHDKANEAVERLKSAAEQLTFGHPIEASEVFLNSEGEAMDVDGGNNVSSPSSSTPSTPTTTNSGQEPTRKSGDSLFVPEKDVPMQTTEGSGDASSDAEEKWPWATGLTAQGERIMAYRTHGRGYRCAVETEKGNGVFRLQSGMECGGFELKQYLKQEGIRQFAPPETRRKWTFEHRDDFKGIWRMAVSEYKTHNPSSKTGRRKDPEAWCFANWTWGIEDITVSDLRKVIGAQSADAAIRTHCNKNKSTPPMDQTPQQVLVTATTEKNFGGSLKQVSYDANHPGESPKVKTEKDGASVGEDFSVGFRELREELRLLRQKVEKVDELEKTTTTLALVVMKLAEKVGISAD